MGSNIKIKVFMFHQVSYKIVDWKDNEYCITAVAFACFLEKAFKIQQTIIVCILLLSTGGFFTER